MCVAAVLRRREEISNLRLGISKEETKIPNSKQRLQTSKFKPQTSNFNEEKVLRGREEAGESGGEVGEAVAFGLVVADAEVAGGDAEGGQVSSEVGFVQGRVAVVVAGPGASGQVAEGLDQEGGEEALRAGVGKDEAEVGQQLDRGRGRE